MRSKRMPTFGLLLAGVVFAVAFQFAPSVAKPDFNPSKGKDLPGMSRILVLDGSTVHNVGELQVHAGNWGLFGSYPNSNVPFAGAPSAQWPSGSGVEYLYGAGLWVGAVQNGLPAVSTVLYQAEFRPTDDPVDIMYRSSEGARGGNRAPFRDPDDDGDGLIDEDRLDGHDNDGDGLIDEDYAALSKQMFSCWYTDDQPIVSELYPQHEPLHLKVEQESYQWEDDRFDDFVGIKYMITNTGPDVLQDVYLGFFADCDIGARGDINASSDDGAGYWKNPKCTPLGPAMVEMGYMYDVDGDDGQTPGYIGILLLGHTTDPMGMTAPREVEYCTRRVFSGNQSYEEGGDPTNDFERYELLSSHVIDYRNYSAPRDYRFVVAVGPYPELLPGQTVSLHLAIVLGGGMSGLIDNAAYAKRIFDGGWYDLDGNPLTGIDRRETPVTGPAENVVIDACRPGLSDPVSVPAGEVLWINHDCSREELFAEACKYGAGDSLVYRTGLAGREGQVHWVTGEEIVTTEVVLDIEPGRCPNWINIQEHPRSKTKNGKLSAAILGTQDLDVNDIDLSSITLEGAAPLKCRIRDRFNQECDGRKKRTSGCRCSFQGEDYSGRCTCSCRGRDGYDDLLLTFQLSDVLDGKGTVQAETLTNLTLTGSLNDGTELFARDCVLFVGRGCSNDSDEEFYPSDIGGEDIAGIPALEGAHPNPFNPMTRISFTIPERTYVKLFVYDVQGKLVARVVSGVKDAGHHVVEWDAGRLPSGIYFYRLQVDNFSETKKMVLLK